ncbi:DNA repair protein RecN [Erysipelothrix urinaevulpis]|uniref:DNA repair protein RecN n=1 Tax=Erysipelothrix urinaevulpis TaxID=2683717 RepID=UPI00135CDC33|nr:DNA repair protein RecN [Erysipelothrix urinaevulpis]
MLDHLKVQNYVLIKENEITLSNNFNVFTGETGAGKSLLVDALNFVTGQRSSASVVGPHSETTRVEAVFRLPSTHEVVNKLHDYDLYEADSLILSREMTQDGRSTARINGRLVNLSVLKEISSLMIDIHSQHETQYLLKQNNHLRLLDLFSKNQQELSEYQNEYKKLQDLIKEKKELLESNNGPEAIEFAKFQLKEIETLNPSLKDYEELENSLNIMKNFEKHSQNDAQIKKGLSQAMESLYPVLEAFETSRLSEYNQEFKDLYYRLDDFNLEYNKVSDSMVFDEFEFDQLNKRMFEYSKLIRKYGSLENLIDKIESFQTVINQSEDFDYLNQILDKKIEQQEIKTLEKARNLSQKRNKNKARLERKILEQLNDLLLENAIFKVNIRQKELDVFGQDSVYFEVAMNKGSELQPLAKVASGGELSRLMLGLKVIFSDIFGITTIVFDEIDTGVSGKAGLAIAHKMKQLSNNAQVLTITHLSSVAAYADVHYLITKSDDDKQSTSALTQLTKKQRIAELAMMMAGNTNPSSIAAAQLLLEEGQNN